MSKEPLDWRFMRSLAARKLVLPVREYRFAQEIGREWRFDLCWEDARLAVEIEGGAFSGYQGERSRHTDGVGYANDCDKYNTAAEMGWVVLRVTDRQVDSGDGAALVERMLTARLGEEAAHANREQRVEAPLAARRPRPKRGAERFGHATATEVASWRKH